MVIIFDHRLAINMKGFPPRCFLIGAQKAGTTYLASLLEQNPEIHVSNPKETDFFTGRVFSRGIEWYRQCFPSDVDKVLIDASTSYSAAFPLSDPRSRDLTISFNGVAERIQKTVPGARFIYIIRNPLKRMYSAYWHFVRAGMETRSFHEAITAQDNRSEYYLLLSNYYVQLEHYLKYFEMSRFNVLIFEDFIKAPKENLQSCFRFLNVNEKAEIDLEVGKHKSYQYSGVLSKVAQILSPWGGLRPVLGMIKKVIPEVLLKQGMRAGTKSILPMESDDFEVLLEYFVPSIEQLEKFLGRPLVKLWTKI